MALTSLDTTKNELLTPIVRFYFIILVVQGAVAVVAVVAVVVVGMEKVVVGTVGFALSARLARVSGVGGWTAGFLSAGGAGRMDE